MQTIRERLLALRADRLVVLCIGNRLRADDGFGPAVSDRVGGRITPQVFDAGAAPENELGRIATLEPDTVLLVDAVDFGAPPGEVRLLEPEHMREDDISTHGTSIAVLARFLSQACGAGCLVLAAQPACTTFGEPMSVAVADAANRVAELMLSVFPRAASGDGVGQ